MSRTVDSVQHNIRVMTEPLSQSCRKLYFSILIIKGVDVGGRRSIKKKKAGRSRVRFRLGRWGSSGLTVALRSTQPLTKVSTSNVSWGVKVAGA
jgi:hypothetical protein